MKAKFFLVTFLACVLSGSIYSQATIPVNRTTWSSTPTGWSDNQGSSPTYGSDICGGSDLTSGRLDNTGENFVVNYNTGASNLTFCVLGNAFSGGTFSVEESVNGTAWTTVQSYTALGAASSKTLTLNCLSRYVRFIYTNKSAGNVQLDNVSVTQGTCASALPCTDPLTNASAASTASVGCNNFTLNWTSGSGDGRLVIVKAGSAPTAPTDGTTYAASATYGSGTAVGGGYAVYSGSGNTVTVGGLAASTTYYYAIYEYNSASCTGINYQTTGIIASGSVATGTCNICPHMTGALINACDGACSEGDNEILLFNSGSYSIPVSPANIKVFYGTTSSLSTSADNYTESFTTSPSITSNLNSLAGCGTLFYDASAVGTIPAGKVFMVMRSTACFNYDFSAFCSAGPIYVLYSTDASWLPGGNFANSGTAGVLRYFKTDFSATATGCVTSYNYEPNQLVGSDGAGVSFPDAGGAASSYFNNGCSPPTIILPVDLVEFYATQNAGANDLFWKTASEGDARNYIVEKSADGSVFSELAKVVPQGKPRGYSYTVKDESPNDGLTYYRLSTTESNGTVRPYQIIYEDRHDKKWQPLVFQQDENLVIEFKNYLPQNCSFSLLDFSGKEIASGSLTESRRLTDISGLPSGLYFTRIYTPYKTFNSKVFIQK